MRGRRRRTEFSDCENTAEAAEEGVIGHVNYLAVRRNYGNATQPPTSSGRKPGFHLLYSTVISGLILGAVMILSEKNYILGDVLIIGI